MPAQMDFEREYREKGHQAIAGVDEAGRGSFSGPVAAAAVILDLEKQLTARIDDSKKLREKERRSAFSVILSGARACAVALVDQETIDAGGIGRAVKIAMRNAVAGLQVRPDFLLVDGFEIEEETVPQRAVIRGDEKSVSIAAASIVAKVFRDDMMAYYQKLYPQYQWRANKGYGTKYHRQAIRTYGPSFLHRFSFRGVGIDQ